MAGWLLASVRGGYQLDSNGSEPEEGGMSGGLRRTAEGRGEGQIALRRRSLRPDGGGGVNESLPLLPAEEHAMWAKGG